MEPVRIKDRLYRRVREGQAIILAPYRQGGSGDDVPRTDSLYSKQPKNNAEGDQAVFYNPIQQYNRDLSVLAILIYGESAIATKEDKNKLRNRVNNQKKSKRNGVSRPEASKSEDIKVDGPKAARSETQPADSVQFVPIQDPADDAQHTHHLKRTATEADLIQDLIASAAKRAKGSESGVDVKVELPAQEISETLKTPSNAELAHSSTEHSTPRRPPFTILDALSASGLRAIRYAKEIPFASTIVANDMLAEAVDAIKLNVEQNGVADKVYAQVSDARKYMSSKTGDEDKQQGSGYVHRFDVVDLDPYGTAAPFVDAAIQALTNGGMLCVTCTDAGVFASNAFAEKAYVLYNGMTCRGAAGHEVGLRLILHSIAATAAKYGIAIEPLLSLSIDFYARLFIRVHKSQSDCKFLAGTSMYVHNCDNGCGSWSTHPVGRYQALTAKNGETYYKYSYAQAPTENKHCGYCGSVTHFGGPMWAGPLHNPEFVRKILNRLPDLDRSVYGTLDRVKGMLSVALEEERLDWDADLVRGVGVRTSADSTKPPRGSHEQAPNSSIIPRMPPHLLSPSPFFFTPSNLAGVVNIPTPSDDEFRSAFLALGYTCTRSHCKPGSMKTNAPWNVIWEVTREYVRQKCPDKIPRLVGEGDYAADEKRSLKRGSPGYEIVKKLRGRSGDTLGTMKVKEELLEKLGFGSKAVDIEKREDLETVLKAALYELEHGQVAGGDAAGSPNGGAETEVEVVDEGAETEKDAESPNEAASPSTALTGKELIDSGGDPSDLKIVFDPKIARSTNDRRSRRHKLVRYQINPRRHWGPMSRAGGVARSAVKRKATQSTNLT